MLYNSFIEYKKKLNTFTLEEQLKQIDATINLLATRKYKGNIKDNRYERIRELKHMKLLLSSKCNNES